MDVLKNVSIHVEKGDTYGIIGFPNLLTADVALNDGDMDVNVEQYSAYPEIFNANTDGGLVPISPIPIVPAAIQDHLVLQGVVKEKNKDSDWAKAIVEGVLNDDLSKKITASLEDILVMRHDGIKLSEIVKKYRDFVRSDTDSDDAERYRCFCSQIDVRPDGIFTQAELRFSPVSEWDADDYNSILVRIQQFREDPASIYVLEFGGVDMKKAIQLRYLNEFQQMMMNLMLNETKIIMDYDAAIRETGDASYAIWD